ncbi:hypothetical protein LMG23994_05567 [Cupriavidus pinatubonensis]|uniref:2-oxoadipate dioxygenase/decarboxylase n=2 Tax=Cupriavidus pinatubonensis TaxID=248026 RepID=A0ABN7ZG84_9BURK|nr:hypothetical protein LMG23994_05567 [Cupriavidus pinatubonensis]
MLPPNLAALLRRVLDGAQVQQLDRHLTTPPLLRIWEDGVASRAEFAQALSLVLFHDVHTRLAREQWWGSPTDAMRIAPHTIEVPVVQWNSGALPQGELALSRILEPLGYRVEDHSKRNGQSVVRKRYRHIDAPDHVTQIQLCEIHPLAFGDEFALAVDRIVSRGADPLSSDASELLSRLEKNRCLPIEEAKTLMDMLVRVFGRHHAAPVYEDYRAVAADSPDMGWLATEGLAPISATVRVVGVPGIHGHDEMLLGGSTSLNREFVCASGVRIRREVPGPRILVRREASGEVKQTASSVTSRRSCAVPL